MPPTAIPRQSTAAREVDDDLAAEALRLAQRVNARLREASDAYPVLPLRAEPTPIGGGVETVGG